jgi:hypothetical protein
MNVIEMFVILLISAALVAIGELLSHWLGVFGLLITAVPVGLFWAYFFFASIRAALFGPPGRGGSHN